MKDYNNNNPVFSSEIKIVETTDAAHADNINVAPEQLLDNTVWLKNEILNKQDRYLAVIDLTDTSVYSADKYYPVSGTILPENGMHEISVSAYLGESGKPSWAAHADGFECCLEISDSKNAYGICRMSYAKHTQNGANPCGYVQMRNSGTPVMIMRGGGKYHFYADYPCQWTIRTGAYSTGGETVRPGNTRVLQFEKTVISANLDGNADTARKIQTVRTINGMEFDGSGDVKNFAVCSTPENIAAKEVSIPGMRQIAGTEIRICFEHGNIAENPTLNVNGNGAKPIYYHGSPVPAEYLSCQTFLHLEYVSDDRWHVAGDLTQAQVDSLREAKADWKQTDVNALDFIRNKPDVKTGSGKYSVDAGYRCSASGIASFTEGNETRATQSAAHAEGSSTQANGQGAHSEGVSCIAGNNAAHAEGMGTHADGTCSHAEGYLTAVSGTASHAEGCGTVAQSSTQHAEGRFNVADGGETYIHIAGNGTADNARSNAYTLDWHGNAEFAGDVTAKGCGGSTPVSMMEMKRVLDAVDALVTRPIELGTPKVGMIVYDPENMRPDKGDDWYVHDLKVSELNDFYYDMECANHQCITVDIKRGHSYKVRTYYKEEYLVAIRQKPFYCIYTDLGAELSITDVSINFPEFKEGVCEYVFTAPDADVLIVNNFDTEKCGIEVFEYKI